MSEFNQSLIPKKDLLEWENSLRGIYSVKRLNNQSVSE